MKYIVALFVLALAVAPVSAGTIERVGAGVVGEATYVPAVRFVSETGSKTITTERYAKGRDLGDVVIVAANAFDPTDLASAVEYVSAMSGEAVFADSLGGSLNFYSAGVDGIPGTSDDVIERDNDRF